MSLLAELKKYRDDAKAINISLLRSYRNAESSVSFYHSPWTIQDEQTKTSFMRHARRAALSLNYLARKITGIGERYRTDYFATTARRTSLAKSARDSSQGHSD